MLHIILSGLLAYAVIKFIEKIQARNDHVSTGAIVTSTIVLGLALNIVVKLFELPAWYGLLIFPVYYVFPLLILRNMWELSRGRSNAYAGVIFGSILVVELVLYIVLQLSGY